MALRRLQTGSVRVYAASLFLGVVLILGYYLWSSGRAASESDCLPAPRRGAAPARRRRRDGERDDLVRWIALGVSLVGVRVHAVAVGRFSPSPSAPEFQFVEQRAWIPAFGISYHVGSTASACS